LKQLGLVAVALMMAAICAGQTMPAANGVSPHGGMQNSQGVPASSQNDFGTACGIRDSSSQSAMRFSRTPEGEWSAAGEEKRLGPSNTAVARVWRESNWMVDMHDAMGPGMTTMHTTQMCFDARGQITHMIDRYMDMPSCGCMRYTSLSFNASGNVARREQRFVSVTTGSEIAVPESAEAFPEVFRFRRLEQLPFYSLVKK